MHERLRVLGAVLITACSASMGHAAPLNLVTNGGFETGDFSGWTLVGDQTLNGVTCAPGFGAEGNCAAFFGPIGTTGGISQALSGLTVGGSYDVSFALEASGDAPSSFTASFGGVTLLNLVNPPATTPPYTDYTFDVQAAATSETLTFNFRDDFGFITFDAVSVTAAVPEPATLALVGTGLAGLGFARRRRPARCAPPGKSDG